MKKLLSVVLCLLFALSAFAEVQDSIPPEGITILLTCVGDCTLGGVANHTASSEKMFARAVDKNGVEWFLENVRYLFEADDFTLINLEGPLTTATVYEDKASYYFRGRPQDVAILTCSSVEVATLANNHSHNFREAGYEETVKTLIVSRENQVTLTLRKQGCQGRLLRFRPVEERRRPDQAGRHRGAQKL